MQVFSEDLDKDMIILLAARASRMENKDAIDTAIIGMLADPKEVNLSPKSRTYSFNLSQENSIRFMEFVNLELMYRVYMPASRPRYLLFILKREAIICPDFSLRDYLEVKILHTSLV
jgi:hypothetical protein